MTTTYKFPPQDVLNKLHKIAPHCSLTTDKARKKLKASADLSTICPLEEDCGAVERGAETFKSTVVNAVSKMRDGNL